ncbi:MAG: hypothetical protein M1818_001270 [Claussenomyces sp. TS43310]|nr:MAG: hypothetical protein M1818_001270 [Claussenomyces sp. TS43310]
MPPLNFVIPIYDRPVYTRGSGPPMMPVTLLPPDDNSGWIINEKVELGGVPQYVVSHRDEPHFRPAVRLEKVLDWVSQRVFEDFELELAKEKDRICWEEDEKILEGAERIRNRRLKVANRASHAQRALQGRRPERVRAHSTLQHGSEMKLNDSNSDFVTEEDVTKGIIGEIAQPSTLPVLKRKSIHCDQGKPSPSKRRALSMEIPALSSQPSLSEEARRLQPSLSQQFLLRSANGQSTVEEGSELEGQSLNDIQRQHKSSSRRKSSSSMAPPSSISRSLSRSHAISQSPEDSIRSSRSISSGDGNLAANISISRSNDHLITPVHRPKVSQSGFQESREPIDTNGNGDGNLLLSRESSLIANTLSPAKRSNGTKPSTRKKRTPKKSKKQAKDDAWNVKTILNHEYRDVDGEQILYYLIDWECDYEGQWDPSWEPEHNVGTESKANYRKKLARRRHKPKTNNDEMPKTGSDEAANGYAQADEYPEGDEFGDLSPSAQLAAQLMEEPRLEVESPYTTDDEDC